MTSLRQPPRRRDLASGRLPLIRTSRRCEARSVGCSLIAPRWRVASGVQVVRRPSRSSASPSRASSGAGAGKAEERRWSSLLRATRTPPARVQGGAQQEKSDVGAQLVVGVFLHLLRVDLVVLVVLVLEVADALVDVTVEPEHALLQDQHPVA